MKLVFDLTFHEVRLHPPFPNDDLEMASDLAQGHVIAAWMGASVMLLNAMTPLPVTGEYFHVKKTLRWSYWTRGASMV